MPSLVAALPLELLTQCLEHVLAEEEDAFARFATRRELAQVCRDFKRASLCIDQHVVVLTGERGAQRIKKELKDGDLDAKAARHLHIRTFQPAASRAADVEAEETCQHLNEIFHQVSKLRDLQSFALEVTGVVGRKDSGYLTGTHVVRLYILDWACARSSAAQMECVSRMASKHLTKICIVGRGELTASSSTHLCRFLSKCKQLKELELMFMWFSDGKIPATLRFSAQLKSIKLDGFLSDASMEWISSGVSDKGLSLRSGGYHGNRPLSCSALCTQIVSLEVDFMSISSAWQWPDMKGLRVLTLKNWTFWGGEDMRDLRRDSAWPDIQQLHLGEGSPRYDEDEQLSSLTDFICDGNLPLKRLSVKRGEADKSMAVMALDNACARRGIELEWT